MTSQIFRYDRVRLFSLLLLLAFALAGGPSWGAVDPCVARYKALLTWRTDADALSLALEGLPPAERKGYEDLLDALYFVDYKTSAPELFNHFVGNRPLWRVRFPYAEEGGLWLWRYQLTKGNSGLDNYRAGKKFLAELKSPVTAADFETLHGKLFASSPKAGKYADVSRRAEVTAALAEFQKGVDALGSLKAAAKLDAYVNLAARLHQRLVTNNALGEGTSRAANVLLNHLLESQGLPPARLVDADRAITASTQSWAEEVKLGIQSTRNLQADLARRFHEGRPIHESVEFLTPFIPRETVVGHYTDGRKYRDDAKRVAVVESGQYAAYLKVRLTLEPTLRESLRLRPVETTEQLFADFSKYLESKRLDFKHKTAGEENLELNLVEPDYYREFGVSTFADTPTWKAKMARWHREDIVWRGLSYQSQEMAETEILSMFEQIHPQSVSNELLKSSSASPDKLRRLALAEFDRYNADLVTGKLRDMAKDHSESGPMYGSSYGLSTSRRKIVGEAFAMGAMVIAPYGEHRAPELQAKLKDRIVVGSYRGKKDVDLARLHQLDPAFSYKYGRQMEVMAVGAVDPDAVMVVQRLNAEGEVVVSYVRNPKNPSEVWVVTGDYSADAPRPPPKARIQKIVSLLPAPDAR